MSNLFANLSTATRALEAQRFGLEVTGQNIANVNTPGYSRRVADFAAVPPDSPRSAGGGVDVAGVRAARDLLIERRLSQEVPAERREAAMADALRVVETALGVPGASIDASLTAFYNAFASLAESPLSPVARQEVALQGEALARAFNDMAQRLDLARRDADQQVRSGVDDANSLITRIAALNESIGGASGGALLHLQDEQSRLVRELSEIIDVSALATDGGGVHLTVGSGRPLVIGSDAFTLGVSSAPPSGNARILSGGVDVTAEVTGGSVGGRLRVRDVELPSYLSRLDTLAFDVAGQVNTLHRGGFDAGGTTNRDFFAPIAAAAGAASSIRVDPALAADHSRIAASGAAGPGDNRVAREIAGLRDAKVLNGGTSTLGDAWTELVYRVGRDARAARDAQASREEIVRQVDALRDQVSGISLDEEAMHLLKFQRAYEANARFFSVIDQTIATLMQELGR